MAVALDDLAVGGQAAALAQVADEVPVQGGLVLAAGLGVRAAEREVDGAADLLVEQRRADRAVDAEVRPDADLAEPPRTIVGGQRALQVVLAVLGGRGDDEPVAELQVVAGDDGTPKWTAPLALEIGRASCRERV